ncbi:MAG TPA: Abi-alpha family protein, partial [Thermoanaerobaculia bacterium]|nr:Abi-alpha family protein [Thermoanaerobaculia bacterium]
MEIDKVVDVLGLPKVLVEGAQSFLNRLLGPAVDETGLLLADKIRFRRLRNQVKIAAKAQELLVEAGLEPKPAPLQTIVPLLEKASLEEEPSIQTMWATLLANAAASDARAGIQRLAVEILAQLSPREALILRHVYEAYLKKEAEWQADPKHAREDGPPAEFAFFRPRDLHRVAEVDTRDGDLLLDNLLRLGVLRFEVPEIELGQNSYPEFVQLTELGLAVLDECMEGP